MKISIKCTKQYTVGQAANGFDEREEGRDYDPFEVCDTCSNSHYASVTITSSQRPTPTSSRPRGQDAEPKQKYLIKPHAAAVK